MNLYRIEQNSNVNYDTFDSAVVAAPDEETARRMNPRNGKLMSKGDWTDSSNAWCKRPTQVNVTLIGTANEGTEQGLILASFNAG